MNSARGCARGARGSAAAAAMGLAAGGATGRVRRRDDDERNDDDDRAGAGMMTIRRRVNGPCWLGLLGCLVGRDGRLAGGGRRRGAGVASVLLRCLFCCLSDKAWLCYAAGVQKYDCWAGRRSRRARRLLLPGAGDGEGEADRFSG